MANVISGTPQNDTLTGSEFEDWISGNGGNDSIDAGDGNDYINLLVGMHTVLAGAGDDIIMMTGPQSSGLSGFSGHWDGGSGYDAFGIEGVSSSALTVDFTNFWGGGTITLGSGTVTGFEKIDLNIWGSMFADSITLGIGSDRSLFIRGFDGNDTIVGANLGERFDGGDGDDFVDTLAGDDSVEGSAGDDTVYGREGNDSLYGGMGDDIIYGGAGDDVIGGGPGQNRIDGGEGIDRAVFIAKRADSRIVMEGQGYRVFDLRLFDDLAATCSSMWRCWSLATARSCPWRRRRARTPTSVSWR